jgi:hypothetical protein
MLVSVTFANVAARFAGKEILEEEGVLPLVPSSTMSGELLFQMSLTSA